MAAHIIFERFARKPGIFIFAQCHLTANIPILAAKSSILPCILQFGPAFRAELGMHAFRDLPSAVGTELDRLLRFRRAAVGAELSCILGPAFRALPGFLRCCETILNIQVCFTINAEPEYTGILL